MQTIKATDAATALTKEGVIRAAINIANPALAKPGPNSPVGITVDIARRIATDLGARLELVVCESAAKVVDALKSEECDIAFMAMDPAREADFSFSDSYLTIEGVYGVRSENSLTSPADVDQPGIRIAATAGAAYTQFLSRSLKNAQLTAAPDGFKEFFDGNCDAVAGIHEAVESFAAEAGNIRVVRPAFMEIRQAVAVSKANGTATLPYVNDLLTRHFGKPD